MLFKNIAAGLTPVSIYPYICSMIFDVEIEEFLNSGLPVIDVRSPAEFERGHIPGSYNIPLFSNEERAQVGTAYVQQSQQEAIDLGYELVTPKLERFISQSKEIAPNGHVSVHCWRGGMRSHAFAQYLSNCGFERVLVLSGGYKAYRNHVLNFFSTPFNLKILGGFTGSGKTHVLEELKRLGHQVVDLEFLAKHKGSAFGLYENETQPTVEQFENNLFSELARLDTSQPIWLEDESHSIGSVYIPLNLYLQMKSSTVYFIDVPVEERAKLLVNDYSQRSRTFLADAIRKITKRLGGQNANAALELLREGNFFEVALITLTYYDKAYLNSLSKNHTTEIIRIGATNTNACENCKLLLQNISAHEQH